MPWMSAEGHSWFLTQALRILLWELLDCCMVKEFFRALAFQAGITLHLKVLYGENDHHKIEAIFKAFAHALREAVTETDKGVLSSKGVL